MIHTQQINLETSGAGDIQDITTEISQIVLESEINSGTVTVFVPGSTAGLTTIEYESGLLSDLPELMEKLVPSDRNYEHDNRWHDGNGFSHLRSAMIGPDITIPFVAGKLTLGTWQQVVFLEFDNRSRSRSIVVQVMGE